jgi:hypothetical protein
MKTTPEGKQIPNRRFEFLNIHLKENPTSIEEREKNNEQLELAKEIRRIRESDFLHNSEGMVSPTKKNINFIDYFQ